MGFSFGTRRTPDRDDFRHDTSGRRHSNLGVFETSYGVASVFLHTAGQHPGGTHDVLGGLRVPAFVRGTSTCSKPALAGFSVASGAAAAGLVLPNERRKASFEAFLL